jgi:NADH:ubiquinone oxidoreductase subunit
MDQCDGVRTKSERPDAVIPRWPGLGCGLDRAVVPGHSAADRRGASRDGAVVDVGDAAVSALWTNHFFTILRSWLRGELVGKDAYGNRYYRERGRKDLAWRRERRWVLFNGIADPTEVPPGWVGWLHKRIELPPSEVPLPAPRWEQERLPNLTGTDGAYLPPGAIQRGGHRAPATGDYEAWRPD